MTKTTWTTDEIRSALAHEMRLMRTYRKRYPEPKSQEFYDIVQGYIRELGHELFERPERKGRQ